MSVKKLLAVSSLLCATFGHASQTTSFSREEISGLFNTPSVEVASLSDEQLKGAEGGGISLARIFAFIAAPMQTVGAVQMPNVGQTLRQVSNACSGPLCQVGATATVSGAVGTAVSLVQPVINPVAVSVGLTAGCLGGITASACINPANRNAIFFGTTPTPVTVITPPINSGGSSSGSSNIPSTLNPPSQTVMGAPTRLLSMSPFYGPYTMRSSILYGR
jgi:hypothetical protein